MNNNMDTSYLHRSVQEYLRSPAVHNIQPRLFICFEHEILEFPLEGHQVLGRPADDQVPDIPVTNRFVSRNHGFFDTTDQSVRYTAQKTSNGVIFRRKLLEPGETVDLWDGDELIIPTGGQDESVDVMLVCAFIESRIDIWRSLKLAARDPLTGLSGRNTFRTWYILNHAWKRDERISLFILDIDHFKRINDVYGHAAGDSALKALAEALRLAVGGNGYVCRWGGDEFVGIMEGDAQTVQRRLGAMADQLAKTRIEDLFYMSISAGVMEMEDRDDIRDVDGFVVLADQALYRAKDAGRGCVMIYEGA